MNTVNAPSDAKANCAAVDLPCPVETTLLVIGGRWKALILFHLQDQTWRFNELRRLIPNVTQRMLTAHLRELERDGVVVRKVYPVVPPRVEYSLSALGQTLTPILMAMAAWGGAYQAETGRAAQAASADPLKSDFVGKLPQ
jgi:DNA-binding HxlR family transcriptional regulator